MGPNHPLMQVNKRLYDPSGSGAYRIPDLRVNNHVFDLTIGEKFAGQTSQVDDFINFSGGARVIIIRPTQTGGSCGILP